MKINFLINKKLFIGLFLSCLFSVNLAVAEITRTEGLRLIEQYLAEKPGSERSFELAGKVYDFADETDYALISISPVSTPWVTDDSIPLLIRKEILCTYFSGSARYQLNFRFPEGIDKDTKFLAKIAGYVAINDRLMSFLRQKGYANESVTDVVREALADEAAVAAIKRTTRIPEKSEVIEDHDAKVVFHPQLAGYERGKFEYYGSVGLGYSVRYYAASGMHVDIYVYDYNLSSIPAGNSSVRTQAHAKEMIDNILEMQKRGHYGHVEVLTESNPILYTRTKTAIPVLYSALEIEFLQRDPQGLYHSFNCLTGWNNCYIKFRGSVPQSNITLEEARKEFANLVIEFFTNAHKM